MIYIYIYIVKFSAKGIKIPIAITEDKGIKLASHKGEKQRAFLRNLKICLKGSTQ